MVNVLQYIVPTQIQQKQKRQPLLQALFQFNYEHLNLPNGFNLLKLKLKLSFRIQIFQGHFETQKNVINHMHMICALIHLPFIHKSFILLWRLLCMGSTPRKN
jgi:hypothetical protein